MARKDEKVAGIYEFCNEETSFSYVGKSGGLGAIIRSVKSKLKKGTFHNKSLQEEYVEHGIDAYKIIKHFPIEGESIADLLLRIEKELLEDGFMLHNNIEVIKLDGEEVEIDKYKIDELSPSQQEIVSTLINAFIEHSPDVSIVKRKLAEIQIYTD